MSVSEARSLCCGNYSAMKDNRFIGKAKYLKMKSKTLSKMMNGQNNSVAPLYSSLFRIGDSVFSYN